MSTKLIGILLLTVCFSIVGWGVADKISYRRGHEVTYYQDGEITKNGEWFTVLGYTCAVRDRKLLDSWLRMEYHDHVIYVYANDLMPANSSAEYDLTPAAFERLAPLARGRLDGVRVRKAE